ncbi:MAG: helix-turn-helix transcriptional regulator [Bacteroidales bacterium]|nr:helix-turn-helix transcriptional regulator [Bacteroidales bacterium]
MEITKQQYEYALQRIEELLPEVNDSLPANDKRVIELTMVSDIVEAYEKKHFPIGKPNVGDIIRIAAEEKGISQRQLAENIGVSPSRINDYIKGRAEPSLRIAARLCTILSIPPAVMLGL